jgi:outer membrane protein
MRRKLKYVGLLFFVFIPGILSAQQDSILKFSLLEAQNYAVANSYAVRSGKLDLESARKKIWETTAIGLPQVSGNITYQNIFNPIILDFSSSFAPIIKYLTDPKAAVAEFSNSGPMVASPQENITYKGTISQLLFSGEYIIGLQASKTFFEMSVQSLRKSEMDTKETMTKTYYQILITQRLRNILKANLDLIDKTLNDDKEMLKVGLVESISVDQLQLNRNDLDNTLSQTDRGIEIMQKLLKFQMGIKLDQKVILTDSLSTFVDQAMLPLVSNQELNLDNYIDAQILKTGEQGSKLMLKREQSKYLPTLAAVFMYQKLQVTPMFNFTPPKVLALSLDIPIFNSGMKQARVGQAKLAYEKSKTTREQAEQGLSLDFQQTRSDLLTTHNKLMSLKESEALSKRIYDITLTKFTHGTASSFELTQSQSQYLQTEGNYYSTVLSLLSLKSKMDKYLNQNY